MQCLLIQEVCHKYWPNKRQKRKFGKFTVETTSEETWGQDIIKRTIKLTNNEQVNCVLHFIPCTIACNYYTG